MINGKRFDIIKSIFIGIFIFFIFILGDKNKDIKTVLVYMIGCLYIIEFIIYSYLSSKITKIYELIIGISIVILGMFDCINLIFYTILIISILSLIPSINKKYF